MERAKLPTLNIQDDDIAALKKQYMEELKSDEMVYDRIKKMGMSIKQVNENVGLLMDFKLDRSVCKNCKGLASCPKANPGYWVDVDFDGYIVKRSVSPCDKVAEKLQRDSLYIVRDFPDEWLDGSLKNIDKRDARKKTILEMINVLTDKDYKWFFLNGDYKAGRSYMAACMANSFAAKGLGAVCFCDTVSLTERLKGLNITSKEQFASLVEQLQKTPLLVLDDFGNEFKSDFTFSNILFPIINYRSKNNLVTVFTSDFTIDEIGEMYSGKVAAARGRQLIAILKGETRGESTLSGVSIY